MYWTLLLASALFVTYCSSEAFANIARHAGAVTKHFPIGLMLSNQVYSINRLNGFLIAPLIGLYVDGGGQSQQLEYLAIVSCVISAFLLICVSRLWSSVLNFFAKAIVNIGESGFTLVTVAAIFESGTRSRHHLNAKKKDYYVLCAQGIATSMAMPTVFILNILAIRFPVYQATLVQSATAISGIGNLLLNFYVFPKMALAETNDEPDDIHHSIMLGKIIGIGVVSPCIIALL